MEREVSGSPRPLPSQQEGRAVARSSPCIDQSIYRNYSLTSYNTPQSPPTYTNRLVLTW